jgi:hypothetical protein
MTNPHAKSEMRDLPNSDSSVSARGVPGRLDDESRRDSERQISTDAPVSGLDRVLRTYDESLLRQVASKLIRPRSQWPAGELIERCLAAFDNLAIIDRRLRELELPERRLLALIGHSGQPRWRVIRLVEMATALGDADGLQTVRNLLEAGLLYPELPETFKRLRSFNSWLTQAGPSGPAVFTHSQVLRRAEREDLKLPTFPVAAEPVGGICEADGLEWPLRLAVIWQLVKAEPFRRTQQGEFFKRDQERLRNDPLLNSLSANSLLELPGAAFFTAEFAAALEILREVDGDWRAGNLPTSWDEGLLSTIGSSWTALLGTSFPDFSSGSSCGGWGDGMPTAVFLSLLCLGQLSDRAWAKLEDVDRWIVTHHPSWKIRNVKSEIRISKSRDMNGQVETSDSALPPLSTFLLTVAYQLRLLQAGKDENGNWLVRLSPLGRGLLRFGSMPAQEAVPNQTLLAQPNLEIVAYRQGLTPGLIGQLSYFAAWKSLGAACLLQVQPETVYRALEAGFTFDKIRQTLERHGTRPTPPAVIELLRTWTAKRERLSLFPSATLFEFTRPEDLNDALARGLPATRLSDRLAVVPSESAVDFRHFRLSGTRDYALPPEKCIDIESDGVTLAVDSDRSDLLVETELRRFAQPWEPPGNNGSRLFRVTSSSLREAIDGGWGMYSLEEWFQQRTGRSLTPAIRLLMTAPLQPAVELKQQLVLFVNYPEVADGLLQLTETRALIQSRLGPTALAILPEHQDELRRRIEQLGLAIHVSLV